MNLDTEDGECHDSVLRQRRDWNEEASEIASRRLLYSVCTVYVF